MNRDDTRRYLRWMFLRRQARRAMLGCLLLASAWSAVPLAVPLMPSPAPLTAACRQTQGCSQARLCPGWRQATAADDWRPELDVCLAGRFAPAVSPLAPGTVRAWLPRWLRPLLSPANNVWYRPSP